MPITIPILFLHPRLPILRNLFLSPAAPPTTIYKATMPRSLRRDRPLRLQQDKWLRIVDLPVITPLQHPLSSSFPQIPPTLIDQTSAKIASLLTRGLRHLLETRLSIVFVLVRKTQFPWLESRQGSSGAVDLWSRKRWKSSACLLSVKLLLAIAPSSSSRNWLNAECCSTLMTQAQNSRANRSRLRPSTKCSSILPLNAG